MDSVTRTNADTRIAELESELAAARARCEQYQLALEGSAARSEGPAIPGVLEEMLFEQAPCIMMLLTPQARVQAINAAGCAFAGRPRADAPGRRFGELIGCATANGTGRCGAGEACSTCPVGSRIAQVLRSGEAQQGIEGRFIVRRDGQETTHDLLLSLAPARHAGQNGVLLMAVDLSDQKRLERELARSEARYHTIVESSPMGVLVVRGERILYANMNCARHLGFVDPANLVGRRFCDFCPPAVRPLLQARLRRCDEGKVNPPVELAITRADGARRVVESISLPAQFEDGPATLIMIQDVTARHEAEARIRMNAMVLDQLQDQVTLTDLQGRITYVNQATCQATGLPREVLIGAGVERFGENPQRGATQQEIIQRTRKEGQWRGQVVNFSASGQEMLLDCRTALVRDEEGNPVAMCGISTDITVRDRMETALRRSEALTRAVLDSVNAHIAVIGHSGTIIDVNRRWTDSAAINGVSCGGTAAGIGADYLGGLRSAAGRGDADAGRALEGIQRVLDGRCSDFTMEYACHAAGGERWFAMGVTPLPDGGAVVAHTDVTTARLIQEELRQSEERFRLTFEQAPLGAAIVGLDFKFLRVNEALCRITGYTPEELTQRSIADITHPDERALDREQVQQLVSGAIDAYERTKRYLQRNGGIVWGHLTVRLMRDRSGRPLYLLPTVQDVTRRKLQEELLRAQLRLSEAAATLSVDELLQRTIDEAEAITASRIGFFHFVADDERHLLLQVWSTHTVAGACGAEGKGLHYPVERAGVWVDCIRQRRPVIHNDYASLPHRRGLPAGHAAVIRELVVPVIRNERIVAILGVGNKASDYHETDVEAVAELASDAWEIVLRKRAEVSLRQSEQRFRRVVESNMIGIVFGEVESRVLLDANDAFLRIVGRTREELNTQRLRWSDLTAPECRSTGEVVLAGVGDADVVQPCEKVYIRPDGTRVPVLIGGAYLDEHRTTAVGFVLDLTELKLAEERLRASAKLAATGRMAARVAHEINNPLAGIKNAFLLLKDAIAPDYPFFGYVGKIEKEIDRIGRIVRQMYSLHRPEPPPAANFLLESMLQDTIDLARHGSHKAVEFQLSVPDGPTVLRAPEDVLRQVCFNILNNAVDASPPGGVITVTARRGMDVVIAVADRGAGIPAEIQPRIFEPFFSTKDGTQGGGMGLGLSVSRSLMETMGGQIHFQSRAGEGTTFFIHLPTTALAAGAA